MKSDALIRLMLVGDHPVMRMGLANLLGLNPDFEVVARGFELGLLGVTTNAGR